MSERASTVPPVDAVELKRRRKVLSVGELALLFRGDDDSEPYPHVNLVVAICDQIHPASAHQLLCVMYGVPEEGPASAELVVSLEEHAVRTIDAGYEIWSREQRRAA
jgi:hypothetical protein